MAQLTLRLDDDLAEHVKGEAAARGRSVNAWIVAVLRAAVDPELADSEVERTRARLSRAGLLAGRERGARRASTAPDPERVARARRAAGRGAPLSQLVVDDRN